MMHCCAGDFCRCRRSPENFTGLGEARRLKMARNSLIASFEESERLFVSQRKIDQVALTLSQITDVI